MLGRSVDDGEVGRQHAIDLLQHPVVAAGDEDGGPAGGLLRGFAGDAAGSGAEDRRHGFTYLRVVPAVLG